MRKLKTILIGCIAGMVITVISTLILIPVFGIDGVNYVLMIVYVPMFVIAFAKIRVELSKTNKKECFYKKARNKK